MAVHVLDWETAPPAECRQGAVAIGNFDGVHRGHAALVAELRRQAQTVAGPAVVLTFDPHPLQILRPAEFKPVLTTAADRAELLQACGADHVVLLRTTSALLDLTAEEFFAEVIQKRLVARALVEGTNFGFGRGRAGNIEMLARFCGREGLSLAIVPPVLVSGQPVSSSRVRNALLQGAVSDAAALLNRPFRIRGTVVAGQRRGRTIGFPTANLDQIPTLIPGDGVYSVRVNHGDTVWPGAANIGPNPTFGENARKVEVHLIGFTGELLGEPLAIDFLERLRDTRQFAGVSQLVEQLRRDVEQAKRIAGAGPGR